MPGYPYTTARWRRLRASALQLNPLCQDCRAMGLTVMADAVDHVHPISQGGDPFPPLEGLRCLCTPCHSAKTARGPEAGAARTTRPRLPRKGCDANGNPLDPRHPWKLEKSLTTDGHRPRRGTNSQLVPLRDYLEDGNG